LGNWIVKVPQDTIDSLARGGLAQHIDTVCLSQVHFDHTPGFLKSKSVTEFQTQKLFEAGFYSENPESILRLTR
jgi:hypothetical protein